MSIVQELQRDAIGSVVPISELLRKAMVVARKLALKDFSAWVESEMRGYAFGKDVPEYRRIHGDIKAWNPVYGMIPVELRLPSDMAEVLTRWPVMQPISEVESLVASMRETPGSATHMTFSQGQMEAIYSIMQTNAQFPLHFMAQVVPFEGIIQAVRNAVLEWALQLEADGIVGEGLSFSPEEKKMAESNSNQLSIGAIIGTMNGSQLQQSSPHATQTLSNTSGVSLSDLGQFTRELGKWIQSAPLSDDERAELSADLSTVESQIESPKPKNGIISEGLKSLKAVLEKAAVSTLVAHAPDAASQAGVWAKQLEGYLSSLVS